MYPAVAMLLISVAMRMSIGCVLGWCWSLGFVSLLADVNFSQPQVAEEGHEPQPEHVKRSQKRGNDSHQPKRWVVKKGLPKDFVFTEEAAQGREAGNGESGDRHHPERYWNHFAQA